VLTRSRMGGDSTRSPSIPFPSRDCRVSVRAKAAPAGVAAPAGASIDPFRSKEYDRERQHARRRSPPSQCPSALNCCSSSPRSLRRRQPFRMPTRRGAGATSSATSKPPPTLARSGGVRRWGWTLRSRCLCDVSVPGLLASPSRLWVVRRHRRSTRRYRVETRRGAGQPMPRPGTRRLGRRTAAVSPDLG
jgi:hypothetical protein